MISAARDPALRARLLSVTPLQGVRAGSALLWLDGRLLVVQDDAFAIAWVDPRTGGIDRVALVEGGGAPLAKSAKPDFEAAFVGPDRSMTLLGSGSTPARCRAARLDVRSGSVVFLDCTPLFEAIARGLAGTPNIEGAVAVGDTLRLFHRGSPVSAIVDVPLSALASRDAQPLVITPHDLGAVNGVPLTFTDAATCGDALVYLAVAEDTPNAVDDGPIAGAAIGLLSASGARFALLEESDGRPTARKVEGIAIDPASGSVYLVTDPDDPSRPAELCTAALDGFGF